MGCGCTTSQETGSVVNQFIAHDPYYQMIQTNFKVLMGKVPNCKCFKFSRQDVFQNPVIPHEKYLNGKQLLLLSQIQQSILLQKNILVLVIPVTEIDALEVLFILNLYTELNFDFIFLNQEREIKMIFMSFPIQFFSIQFSRCCYLTHQNTQFKFNIEYKSQRFLYFSEQFSEFILKVMNYDIRQLSLYQLKKFGFQTDNTPYFFDDKITEPLNELLPSAISRSLQLRNSCNGLKEGKDVENIIQSLITDLIMISDELQDIFINSVKILVVTNNLIIFQVFSCISNSFSLKVSKIGNCCKYEPLQSSKLTTLEQKFQQFNINLSKRRQPLFQQNDILFENMPSLKTKMLTQFLPITLKDCIRQLLDGINKISSKMSALEFNQLVFVLQSEYFELSNICLTYYVDMQLLTVNLVNISNSENLLQQSLKLIKESHIHDKRVIGAYYKDHEIDLLYRIFNFISIEFDQKLNFNECIQYKSEAMNTSQFIQALYTYVCQIYGFRSYTIQNSIGATISIVQVNKNGEILNAAVDFASRLFFVSESQLPYQYQLKFKLNDSMNNIKKKFLFYLPNASLMKKLVKNLIENSDQAVNLQSSFANSLVNTQRSIADQSGRIDLLERSGRWEVRCWVEGQESYDYFIDYFASALCKPNGQLPLGLKIQNFGQIVQLNLSFSDPIREWSNYFLNKSGVFLVQQNELRGIIEKTNCHFIGVMNLNGLNLLIIEYAD